MPTWAWAAQLHAAHWIPNSQIMFMQASIKHAIQTCQHEREQNSYTLPNEYLTASSRICRFRTNMPLKHADMSVSSTAARSPLNTWQPDNAYAGLENSCHLNMPTKAWAEQLHATRWVPYSQITSMQHASFDQTCRLNMPTWTWAAQLQAPRWIPDCQITYMQVSNKHAI